MTRRFLLPLAFAVFASFFSQVSRCAVAQCRQSQLQVRPFAVDYPGMMKQVTAYAVINRSKQACRLRSDQLRVAVRGQGRSRLVPLRHPSVKPSWYTLPRASFSHPMRLGRVFWFTVLQSEVGAKPPSLVTWMMIPSSRGQKLLEVNLKSAYTDVRLSSQIHRGLADWFMDRQCRASSSNHTTWLRPTDRLNVSHPVVCG